jgi:hypothetical protein
MKRSRFSNLLALRSVARIALALIIVSALGSGAVVASPEGTDAWESPPPASLHDCSSINGSLVVPVPMAHRSDAISRLKNVALVELTPPGVQALLDLPAGIPWSGVDQLKKESERLKKQRREALENHQGSWNGVAQQQLDSVTKTLSDPTTSSLRPFLVRAVVKNEGTDGFFASVCDESLVVVHGSLGHSTPPSIRAPVIVILQKKPSVVYVDWQMAE